MGFPFTPFLTIFILDVKLEHILVWPNLLKKKLDTPSGRHTYEGKGTLIGRVSLTLAIHLAHCLYQWQNCLLDRTHSNISDLCVLHLIGSE